MVGDWVWLGLGPLEAPSWAAHGCSIPSWGASPPGLRGFRWLAFSRRFGLAAWNWGLERPVRHSGWFTQAAYLQEEGEKVLAGVKRTKKDEIILPNIDSWCR